MCHGVIKELERHTYRPGEQKEVAEKILERLRENPTEPVLFLDGLPYFLYFPEVFDSNSQRWALYQDAIYRLPNRKTEELRLLVLEYVDVERKKFERLKDKFDSIQHPQPKRERISESVRISVWRRDEGKCVRCGSRERLEYDHITPVSKGGGNTARNIELLCERCNREKGAKIE